MKTFCLLAPPTVLIAESLVYLCPRASLFQEQLCLGRGTDGRFLIVFTNVFILPRYVPKEILSHAYVHPSNSLSD